jgi:hypothetical protein
MFATKLIFDIALVLSFDKIRHAFFRSKSTLIMNKFEKNRANTLVCVVGYGILYFQGLLFILWTTTSKIWKESRLFNNPTSKEE